MAETHELVQLEAAIDAIKTQITSLRARRRDLWDQILSIDGEIQGLYSAEIQLSKLKKYNLPES